MVKVQSPYSIRCLPSNSPMPLLDLPLLQNTTHESLSVLFPRMQALNVYADRLELVDTKVAGFIEPAIKQTTNAYWITVILYMYLLTPPVGAREHRIAFG
jgi:hypothetical protein